MADPVTGIRSQPSGGRQPGVPVWLPRILMAGLSAWLASPVLHAQPPLSPALGAPAEIALPPPRTEGRLSIEGTLAQRRSLRNFAAVALTAAEAGQLLWAAQGISDASSRRTAPSAGATYPLVLYLVAGRVDGVASGVYRYLPQGHRLAPVAGGDPRPAIAAAAFHQSWMQEAPAFVLVTAQPAATVARYGTRAERYVAIEAGAATQNLLLQAVALGLGGTLVGAFDEAVLKRVVALPEEAQVMAIIPVGHRP